MKRFHLGTMALMLSAQVVLGQPANVLTPGAIPPHLQAAPAAINPALLYWQGIGMLPELSSQQSRLVPDVLSGKVAVTDGKVAALLHVTTRSMARFARAAAVRDQPCVWGTTFDEGPFAPMPHLPKFQMLCRLTLVRAESCFEKGGNEQALEALLTVHRAVRHMASDALLVTVIMQHGMEQQTLRMTGRHALKLPPEARARHLASVRELPPLRSLCEALQVEHRITEWLRHSVIGLQNSPDGEKAALELGEAVLQAQSKSEDATAADAAREGLAGLAEYKLGAAQSQAVHQRLAAICDLPWEAFKKELSQVQADFPEAPAALRSMLSSVQGAKRKELESATLHTMLRAVLTLGGDIVRADLAPYKDAFSGAPVAVRKTGDDVTLSVDGVGNGKPLELKLKP